MEVIKRNGKYYVQCMDGEVEMTEEEMQQSIKAKENMLRYCEMSMKELKDKEIRVGNLPQHFDSKIKVDMFCEDFQKGLQKLYDSHNDIKAINKIIKMLKADIKTAISNPLEEENKKINKYFKNKLSQIYINEKAPTQSLDLSEFDSLYWNKECYVLFHFLIDNYYKKDRRTKRKLTNIWFYLKDKANSDIYHFRFTKATYKVFIKKTLSIELKNFDKSQYDFDKEVTALNDLVIIYENKSISTQHT